ncbi:hypothetical protein, partial [Mesorhizobium sp. M4A.F.Ca.ET.020.02.1.1]|uniref:hypothetical protein n=1 Tax=Mesorhizobium sp. M4A.F.Ca.ET.020.02.1.1 TaxID=2496652 RepID=UPI001AECB75A
MQANATIAIPLQAAIFPRIVGSRSILGLPLEVPADAVEDCAGNSTASSAVPVVATAFEPDEWTMRGVGPAMRGLHESRGQEMAFKQDPG